MAHGSDTSGFLSHWKLRLSTIIWFLLLLGCVLALPVLFDATGLLVLLAVVVALVLGALIAWVCRLITKDRARGLAHGWLKASFASFLVLCIAMAVPFYYFALKTGLDPVLLPRVTLSDGAKTVVIQGMMHIGTERFYKQVVYDAEKALSDGYVLYYEGVQPNPEGDKWFADTLAGGGDLSANYQTMAEICGLQFQLGYFELLQKDFAVHPESHVTADVDTLDMMREYERLEKADPEFAAAVAGGRMQAEKAEQMEGLASTIEWLQQGSEGQRKLAGYVCRWMMNRAGDEAAMDNDQSQIEKVILDYRNRALADRILADPHDKIYITYGAKHIKGVIALLRERDPAWTIESVSWTMPVEAPRELQGEL